MAYLAGAWVVLQVVDVLGPQWGWSPVAGRPITVLLAIGLLVVMTVAWYHGEQGRQQVSGAEAAILTLLLVIGGALLALLPEGPALGTREDATGEGLGSGAGLRPGDALAAEWHLDDERPSVAVLPFDDLDPGPGTRAFAEGLLDDVISRLHKVGSLRVISRTSVQQYRGAALGSRRIGEELQVGTIVTGTVLRSADRVRVGVELTSTLDESRLWGETYDTTLTASNVVAVQEALAVGIVDRLPVRVTAAEKARMSGGGTRSLQALDLFDRVVAMEPDVFVNQRLNEQALRLLEEAVRLDPTFGRARATVAMLLAVRPQIGLPLEWSDSALVVAERILAEDPQNPRAWRAVGMAHGMHGRLTEARSAHLRALELEPSAAGTMNDIGTTYLARCDEALLRFVGAARSDPWRWVLHTNVVWANVCLGRWDAAEEWLSWAREVARDPEDPLIMLGAIGLELGRARFTEARSLAHDWLARHPESPLGLLRAIESDFYVDPSEAAGHAEQLLARDPEFSVSFVQMRALMAREFLEGGDTARASELLAQAEARLAGQIFNGREDLAVHLEMAWLRAVQARPDEALASFRAAVDGGLAEGASLVNRDPLLASLRDLPSFRELVAQMLENQAEQRARVEAVAESLRPRTSSASGAPGGRQP